VRIDRSTPITDTTREAADTIARQTSTQDSTKPAKDSNSKIDNSPIQPIDSALKSLDSLIKAKSADTTTQSKTVDSTVKVRDNGLNAADSANTTKVSDAQPKGIDSQLKDIDSQPRDIDSQPKGDAASAKDSANEMSLPKKRELDTRWFISPLLKFQAQDFSFLEQNRKGYLSDAYTLPVQDRGNGSFAASAYKNLTSRLSISADIGLSFGHVTDNNTLISQTRSKTYNLLNASVYYHLLGPSYRLQPYLTVGINDLINDKSYASAPMGIGAKFNSRKIMALAQATYGYAVSKNIANTMMYSVGVYIPINNKKKKQADQDESDSNNKSGKNDQKKKNDKDTTAKNGNIVNNIYITINMDSVLKAKGLLDEDGNPSSGGRRRRGSVGSGGNRDDEAADQEALKPFNLDDFSSKDFKVEHDEKGHPFIRFVVYFEFNEYSLNSKAFNSIDKVISHIRSVPNLYIEIKGYTDDVGTDPYNNFLSRRRANMVKDYINSRGISADLMKAKAYGKDNPVADNSDPNAAWLNRRAEIIVRFK